MAESLGSMVVRLGADISDFERQMRKAQKVVGNVDRRLTDFGKSMTMRVTVPIAAAGAAVTKFATDMDSLKRGLTAVTGSAAEADRQLKRLREVAKTPGLGFEEAIAGSIRLQAVGISAGFAERALSAFGNAVATTGGGKSDLDRITVQLGQLSAKGKVMAQDLRPIIEAAPLVGKALRDAFGTVDTEEIQKLGLTTEQFMERLVSQLETLPRVTGGARNSFDNFTDSVKVAGATVGNILLPAITAATDKLTDWLNKVQDADGGALRFGVSIALAAAAIGPALIVLGKLTTGIIALTTALKVGLLPLIVAGGPIVIGLTLLSALWIDSKLDAMAATNAVDDYTASIRSMNKEQLLAARTQVLAQRDTLKQQIGNLSGGRGNDNKIANLRGQLGDRLTWFQEIEAALAGLEEPVKKTLVNAANEAADAFAERMEAMDKRLGFSGGRDNTLGDPRIAGGSRGDRMRAMRGRAIPGLDLGTKTAFGGGADITGSAKGAPGFLGQFAGALKSQVMGLAGAFGPLALAAAALKPVFEGLMEVLGPLIKAVSEPLRALGRMIGTQLQPAFRFLAAIVNQAVRALSYLQEGIGFVVKAIGWLVDKINIFGGDGGIGAFGQELIDSARAARDNTNATDGATGAVQNFAAALSNVPNVFRVNAARYGVTGGGGGSTGGIGGGGPHDIGPGGRHPLGGVVVNFYGDVMDPAAVAEAVGRAVDRAGNRMGTTRLNAAFA